jgi:hypothetical protein
MPPTTIEPTSVIAAAMARKDSVVTAAQKILS